MTEPLPHRVSLFGALPAAELQHLTARLQPRQIPPDTILFREGDPGDRCYVVLKGRIEIVKALGTADERRLDVRGPGGVLGEMSLLNRDGRRTASARATTAAQLLEMTRSDFEELLQRHPGLAYHLASALSMQLQEANDATIRDLQEQNRKLARAYAELQTAQAQIVEKETLERELEVARRIQETLLPKQVPTLPGWEIAVHYQPARAVGGDFYNFLLLPDGRCGILIGDVTGKGVPAALVMAITFSIVRSVAHGLFPPSEVLARTNELLHPDIPPGMFVTCLYAVLDPASGHLHYANAGHDLPYRQHDGDVSEVRATGMPLGLMPGQSYEERETILLPGDCVLFYSDGLVEARNAQREMFGSARLRALLAGWPGEGSPQLIEFLLNELAKFTSHDWKQDDDITLVSLQYSTRAPPGHG